MCFLKTLLKFQSVSTFGCRLDGMRTIRQLVWQPALTTHHHKVCCFGCLRVRGRPKHSHYLRQKSVPVILFFHIAVQHRTKGITQRSIAAFHYSVGLGMIRCSSCLGHAPEDAQLSHQFSFELAASITVQLRRLTKITEHPSILKPPLQPGLLHLAKPEHPATE